MARPIFVSKKSIRGLRIVSHMKDDSVKASEFYEGDVVTDFRYINHDIKEADKISGAIKAIGHHFNRIAPGIDGEGKSNFAKFVDVSFAEFDASEKYKSKIVDIDGTDILSYGMEDTDVVKVEVIPTLKVKLHITMTDGKALDATLQEGQNLFNTKIITGIGKSVTGNFTLAAFLFEKNEVNDITPSGVILTGDKTYSISFWDINEIGADGITVTDASKLMESITQADTKKAGGVVVPAGTCTTEITTPATLNIKAALADVPANTGNRASDTIGKDETVLAGKLTASSGSEVEINGAALTQGALVNIDHPKSLIIKNCKFVAATCADAKNYLLKTNGFTDDATKLVVKNCYFGTNTKSAAGVMYNLFELNCKLADGSEISNNYFAKEACMHNVINVYDVADGATINISNNVFEYSANAVRIGCINAPKNVTIIMKNNTYKETDTSDNGNWAGLFLVQPYGKQTTDMSGITIKVDGTVMPDKKGQLYYFFNNKTADLQLTDQNAPTIIVNGKERAFVKPLVI